MSDTLTRDQLRNINRQLAEIRQALQLEDLVNKAEAIKIVGVTRNSFNVYVSQGKYVVASRNAAGQPFFSRKQLMGMVNMR